MGPVEVSTPFPKGEEEETVPRNPGGVPLVEAGIAVEILSIFLKIAFIYLF